VAVTIDREQHAANGVVAGFGQFSPQLDYLHLSVHYLHQQSPEDFELLEDGLMLRVGYLGVLYSLSHEFAEL
jgi:hypothetical protein